MKKPGRQSNIKKEAIDNGCQLDGDDRMRIPKGSNIIGIGIK